MNTSESASSAQDFNENNAGSFGNYLLKRYGVMEIPSFALEENVKVFLMPEGEQPFPGFTAKVIAIHHYVGKTKYDLEIKLPGDFSTRIYNIDGVLITPITS